MSKLLFAKISLLRFFFAKILKITKSGTPDSEIFLPRFTLLRPNSSTLTLRSSHPEVFYKKGVLRNFAKLKGKHLCQSLFFNEIDIIISVTADI